MIGHSYPRAARIRRRREFLRVQRGGRRTHTPHFVVIAGERAASGARLGVTVSSRVGNAVARNRVKRIIREIFRTRRPVLSPATDVVVIAKRGAHDLTYQEVEAEVVPALTGRSRRA